MLDLIYYLFKYLYLFYKLYYSNQNILVYLHQFIFINDQPHYLLRFSFAILIYFHLVLHLKEIKLILKYSFESIICFVIRCNFTRS